jgi:hypothetical protein
VALSAALSRKPKMGWGEAGGTGAGPLALIENRESKTTEKKRSDENDLMRLPRRK